MVTRRDYTAEGVEAARSVLIELVHLLGEYKDDIVLIGGWIPEVLLPHSRQFLEERKVSSWGIWEKEISRFDWHYDSVEECCLLKGKVAVETKDGKVEFGAGDFVTFPVGLSCVWDIKEPVRKHYNFPG